jgi:transcription antitermination factor NusG
MNVEIDSQSWFALQVRTRSEASTSVLLEGKGYQTFLPTLKLKKRWSCKMREINAPMFPGYVFCHFDPQKRLPILITPGVLAVVGRGKIPVPIDESEITAIQSVVASGLQADPWPYLEVGQRIRIEGEALHGLEGILTQFKGQHRIVVSVSLLRRSVALEIDRSCVRPIGVVSGLALKPVASHPFLQSVGA